MKRGMWMGLMAVAVTAGFMAASVSKADVVATPGADSGKKSASGWSAKNQGKAFKKAPKQVIKYVCPMGDYVGDKPGKCPKCGMTLEKKVVTGSVKKEIPTKK